MIRRAPAGAIFDIETCSELDLRRAGAHRYARECSVICLAYRLPGANQTRRWVPSHGGYLPYELMTHVRQGGVMHAWNVAFDRAVWNRQLVPIGFPELALEQTHDIMARALYWGLPGSLDQAGPALNLQHRKSKEGHALMLRMARPRAPGRWWHLEDADKLDKLADYCCGDVDAEAEAHTLIPDLPARERALWLLDQRMNERGVALDLQLIRAMMRTTEAASASLDEQMNRLTGGLIPRTTMVGLIGPFLRREGYPHDDIRRATLQARLPQAAGREREAIRLRLEAARTSTAKLKVMLACMDPDDRKARGMLQYYGAGRTGRWAGRLIQVQNLPRPTIKSIKLAIRQLLEGADPEALELFHADSPLGTIASCLRGCLVPSRGKAFVVADLAQIEARVVAWLAGQADILDVFRSGRDVYTYTAAKVGSDNRQFGKVLVLACVAHDTPVLTHTGWKPIQSVQLTDLVWDGVEWVRHQGLVERGQRETLTASGLPLTPEHRVLCGTEWLPAQSLARDGAIHSRALATASANLPSWAMSSGRAAARSQPSRNAVAADPSISSAWTAYGAGPRSGATPAPGANRPPRASSTGAMLASCQMTGTGAGCSIGSPPSWAGATTPRRPSSTTTAAGASMFTRLGGQIGRLSSATWSRSRAGISQAWSWTARTWTRAMSPTTSGSSRAGRTPATAGQSLRSRPASESLKPKSLVYDLAHCGSRNRFTIWTDAGPLLVHNCGFGMGWMRFQATAEGYGIRLMDDDAEDAVRGWREANPQIVRLWYAYDDAARAVVGGKGGTIRTVRGVTWERWRGHMLAHLPSGRQLVYRDVALEPDPKTGRDSITYQGVDQRTRQWTQIRTYGGKLAENITQAVARDVMADHLVKLEQDRDFAPVLSVHDEAIGEAPEYAAPAALGRVLEVMRAAPSWAPGLPVGAEGAVLARYGK